MRSKRNGTNEEASNHHPNPQPKSYDEMINMHQQSCKEEFSDWPNGLLAIGTFGNNHLKHSDNNTTTATATAQDLEEEEEEEEEEAERELRLLLSDVDCGRFLTEKENVSLERKSCSAVEIRGRRDMMDKSDKRKRSIGKKSLCFLMKKLLLCGALPPNPITRDHPLPDPKLMDHYSTMDKILRAMLHKKIYPQAQSQRPTTPGKYLEVGEDNDDQAYQHEACTHSSKWVKTDSEYIVLEI
ncbi:hypothetical protein C2S51_001976 [Perilla frutescens var. frutescens]|nr:hypothetical protein C2S51_001976 [Perilla frutescens var. frutescens]